MLGLERISSNAILWVGGASVKNGNDAIAALVKARWSELTISLKEFAAKEGGTADFLYLNYADLSQDPLGSYGADNVEFMRDVASQYDPHGFWQKRVPGGFRLSRVVGGH